MIKKITLFMMMSMLFATLIVSASDLVEVTVIPNERLQEVCRNVAQCCKYIPVAEELQLLVGDAQQEVDCDLLLQALEKCIAAKYQAQTQGQEATLHLLEENYQLLADIHAELLKQLGTRARIKIKPFAKLYTDELVATNNMVIVGKLIIKDCLRMPNEVNGLILANNGGCVVGETIVEIKIPDDSIVSADLADGSVTTAKFADEAVTNEKITTSAVTGGVGGKIDQNTITPFNIQSGSLNSSLFAFGTLTTALAEANPLKIVRGYINTSGATPVIVSGTGFSIVKNTPATYSIVSLPYTSSTSYSAFVRPLWVGQATGTSPSVGGSYTIQYGSSPSFTLRFYAAGSTTPQEPVSFEFFTIGT